MKILILLLMLATPAFAQLPDARTAAGCGGDFKFQLKTVKSNHTISRPEPGKAMIYVIETVQQNLFCIGKCQSTVRIGVDARWVAGVKHDSYAFFSIDPGEHHVCADWKSHIKSAVKLSALTVQAEPGMTYYFVIDLSYHGPDDERGYIKLNSIDSAQGQALVSTRKLTTLSARK